MSLNLVSRIGLPIIAGVSLYSIPKALNDSKGPSRSFYEDDEDITISPILSTQLVEETKQATKSKKTNKSSPKEESQTNIETKIVDGYKINTSGFLETHFNSVRKTVIDQVNYIDAEYRNLKSAFNNEYNNLKSNITSVYDPQDQFFPSFIYALTTTLSGSILVNKRSLPIRFITPLIFGTAAFKIFLPKTFDNTKNAITNYEAKEYPELLQYQRQLKSLYKDTKVSIKETNQSLNESLVQSIHDLRTSLTK